MMFIQEKIQPRGTHAWWSPIRVYNKFEKWLGTFTENQLIFATIMVLLSFVAVFIFACIYGTSMDEPPQNTNGTPVVTNPTSSSSTPATSPKKRTKKD